MAKSAPYSRIAITLPAEDLAAADRLAQSQDRSRSWIVAEAVRRYARAMDAATAIDAAVPSGAPAPILKAVTPPDTARTAAPAGLDASRLAQLTRDMALTSEARVRLAEETLRLSEQSDGRRMHRLMAFDRYEDFLDWKRSRRYAT